MFSDTYNMAAIHAKVLCKYLNKLTLLQFLQRTVGDSLRINIKDDEGPTCCPSERAQITTANIKIYINTKNQSTSRLLC